MNPIIAEIEAREYVANEVEFDRGVRGAELAALKLAVEELQRQAGSAEEPKDTMAATTLRAIADKLGVKS